MNRIFTIPPPFQVPDGTWVSPFLNAKDSQSDLPFGLLDGFSLAAGRIDPCSSSKIHIMPFVTQVTFVRSGHLTVRMKDSSKLDPYLLRLIEGEAVLTEPGVFFQLINESAESCEVLYIVSPAYTFEAGSNGQVIYDDSVVLDEDWEELAACRWSPAKPMPALFDRESAFRRIAQRKEAS